MIEKIKSFIKSIFGEYYIFVQQLVQTTLVFIFLLLCIYVVSRLVAILYPLTEGGYVSQLLHLVDAYMSLLGIIGFVIWITLDMVFLLRDLRHKFIEKTGEKQGKNDGRQ